MSVTVESGSFGFWLHKLLFMSEGAILNGPTGFYYLLGYLIRFNYVPLYILGNGHFFSLIPEETSHDFALCRTMIHEVILNFPTSLKL